MQSCQQQQQQQQQWLQLFYHCNVFWRYQISSLPRATDKQEREGGTILSSLSLLPDELNLIDADAAPIRLAAILRTC